MQAPPLTAGPRQRFVYCLTCDSPIRVGERIIEVSQKHGPGTAHHADQKDCQAALADKGIRYPSPVQTPGLIER